MKKLLLAILPLALAAMLQAHFVFVVPEADGRSAKLIMSEDLKSAEEVDIGILSGAKLSLRNAQGQDQPLSLTKGTHAYTITLSGTGTRLIHGIADLGVMQRGQSKPHLLIYYPKTMLGDAFQAQPARREVPVEIVPIGKPGAMHLNLLVQGKPKADAEMMVILPDGTQKKLTTDATGQTEKLESTGRYGAWARYWETVGGEQGGKKYDEKRHYATLVFDATPATLSTSSASPSTVPTAVQVATLPEATSSFGAVASQGWLYVYGGHIAPTHSYSTEAVSGQFNRLDLSNQTTWQPLPAGPTLQGMNLAAHKGKIYRIGGMTPHNKPSDAVDTHSTAECARFDPASKQWEALPPLPEPRSSHDVVVMGDKLMVIGGWNLKGKAGESWFDTMAVLDLSAGKLAWQTAPQPFRRRALIATAYADKLYLMGGFDDKARIVREVSVYDPKTNTWTSGPQLPGEERQAFAPATVVHNKALYVSLGDGALYRLNDSSQQWDKVGMATPRIAHRLASDGKSVLVIGGAAKGRNFDLVEAVAVDKPNTR